MAFIDHKYCYKCEKETQFLNGNCVYCSDRNERMRIAQWNSLTVEEKLQDLRARVEKLERGPNKYC